MADPITASDSDALFTVKFFRDYLPSVRRRVFLELDVISPENELRLHIERKLLKLALQQGQRATIERLLTTEPTMTQHPPTPVAMTTPPLVSPDVWLAIWQSQPAWSVEWMRQFIKNIQDEAVRALTPPPPSRPAQPVSVAFDPGVSNSTEASRAWRRYLAIVQRDKCDQVIQQYTEMGLSGTTHDLEHRRMRADAEAVVNDSV